MRAIAVLSLLGACAAAPEAPNARPNDGLLRDFLDGKFDAAGHPTNARVLEAETLCPALAAGDAIALTATCTGELPEGARTGQLLANIRLRVTGHPAQGAIVTASLVDATGRTLASQTLTVARLRERGSWIDLALGLAGGTATQVRITPAPGATVDVDYIEVFPRRFGLVVEPGSGVAGDADVLTFELPLARKLEQLELDGLDLLPRLDALLAAGTASKTTTEFRTLIEVPIRALAPERADIAELRVQAGSDAARVQLRRTPAPCRFEGDPAGTRSSSRDFSHSLPTAGMKMFPRSASWRWIRPHCAAPR
ncbi:MAG: hypothetical protein WKG01_16415 [Kofleriaceae bacterium]